MTHPGKKVIEELVARLGGVTGDKWSVAGAHPDAILSIAEYVKAGEQERDTAQGLTDAAIADYNDSLARILSLEEENSNLRKALEPFAEAIEKLQPEFSQYRRVAIRGLGPDLAITLENVRAARLALQSKSTEESK